jgi:hypothetical protein
MPPTRFGDKRSINYRPITPTLETLHVYILSIWNTRQTARLYKGVRRWSIEGLCRVQYRRDQWPSECFCTLE